MPGSLIPREVKVQIVDQRRHGATLQSIADATGVALSSVHRVLAEDAATKGADRVRPDGQVLVALSPDEASRVSGDGTYAVVGELRREQELRIAESLKGRILAAVTDFGPFADSHELVEKIQKPTDNWSHHEVVSALHQLRKQGWVTFRIDKKPADGRRIGVLGGGNPRNIEITKAQASRAIGPEGKRARPADAPPPEIENGITGSHPAGWSRRHHQVGKDYTEPNRHGPYASGGPVIRVKPVEEPAPQILAEPEPVAPEPVAEPASYPLLTELQQRLAGREAAAAQSAKLLEAAALLEELDPVESARLVAKAEHLDGDPLSPLEIEYLRFAGDHRG